MPKLDLVNLEAQLKVGGSHLAAAEAERERGMVRAPWDGRRHRGCRRSRPGGVLHLPAREIATLVALDPMLAVVEVAERKLAGIKVGDRPRCGWSPARRRPGRSASSPRPRARPRAPIASRSSCPMPTATFRTASRRRLSFRLRRSPATRVPRSALTFSSTGDIGVRTVDAEGVVAFLPVKHHRGRAETRCGSRVSPRRARDRAGPGFRAGRSEGRAGPGGGTRLRQARTRTVETQRHVPLRSTTPSTMRG